MLRFALLPILAAAGWSSSLHLLVSCGRTHMAYSTRSYARSYSDSGGLPPAIKWLLIVNVGIYLIQFFGNLAGGGTFGTISC